jgi:hypothetical protein
MKQVLLNGTRAYEGQSITVWAPDSYGMGDTVRWNGSPWKVGAVYGTRFCAGLFAKKHEKPRDSPMEKFN